MQIDSYTSETAGCDEDTQCPRPRLPSLAEAFPSPTNGTPPHMQASLESPQYRNYYDFDRVAAMNVNALLSDNGPARNQQFYPPASTTPHTNGSAVTPKPLSPNSGSKVVNFRLHESTNFKTFQIRPHDTTDSIIDTVKHLLGLSQHRDLGVSLENENGCSFIPSYDNFSDNSTVWVRIEENLSHDFARRHSHDPRQSHHALNGALSNGDSYDYSSRSVSPYSRGRRSTSASRHHGRSRSLKRTLQLEDDDHYRQGFHSDGQWYSFPHQQMMTGDYDEPRTKAGSVASADISVENILDGSRRKRAKFSSDELPLFPPPALPVGNGSVSSLSPSRPPAQYATPYTQRNHGYSHPTPPSNAGDYSYPRANYVPIQNGALSAAVPTPAPTVTSCISDEDVAIQLMRLGNANSVSTVSTMGEYREGFVSDCGEFGEEDEGRSDTTELPDPLPPNSGHHRYGLPDSPILYPANPKFKSLDDILPSFDTTEPSDDENQPPDEPSQTSLTPTPRQTIGATADDHEDGGDDEGDENYTLREEDENDGDYEDDLDDVPLKMRRDRKFSTFPTPVSVKPKHSHPKGVAKAIKRQNGSQFKSTPNGKSHHDHHYPISPASPPASRKPSISSSTGNKSRPNSTSLSHPHPHNFGTPSSQEHLSTLHPLEDGIPEEPQRPRCQRCRKSKKGCDRQRPCQRCKDAGIPADQCISEDEAGTRRGRQAAAAAKRAGLQNGIIKNSSSNNPTKMKKKQKLKV